MCRCASSADDLLFTQLFFLLRSYVYKHRLLSADLNVSEVFVRCDDEWRTRQSANANTLGMYPPSTRNGQTLTMCARRKCTLFF